MNPTGILSIAAIILGIYIIFTYLLNQKPQQNEYIPSKKQSQYFHIGCYVNDKNLTNYDHLLLRLSQLKNQAWKKQSKLGSSIITNDYFDNKGVQVAKNFQSFIDDYIKFKSRAQVNIQISKAVSLAKQQFKNCVQQYHGQFSQNICLDDWQSYLRCTTDLNILKTSLDTEIQQKQKIARRINQLIGHRQRPLASPRPSDDFQREFRRRDKQLQDKQKRLQTDIKLLSEKVSQAQYYYQVAQNKTAHALKLYLQCSQNRMQFRKCQQLTRQMQNLGYGSLQSLQAKVQRKRSGLLKMKKLKDQNQGTQTSLQLKRLYEESMKQFTRLYQLFYSTKVKIIKHCGCAQSQQTKLKQNKQTAKKYQDQKLRQYNDLKQSLSFKILTLNDVKDKRKQLQKQLQIEKKKLSTPNHQPQIDRIKLLAELNNLHLIQQQKVLELSNKFNTLQQKCNNIKNRISYQIPKISHIKDCLNKYQYYSEIKKKFQREVPKQIKMNQSSKIKLSRSVKQFVI